MGDKSPRSHESKKSSKSIKEKRAEKRDGASSTQASVVPPGRSGH